MANLIQSGMRLTPARLNALSPMIVRKTSDQSVTNSTTLVIDSQLSLPALAGAEYDVELMLIYEATAAGDFRCGLNFPAGATMTWGMIALDTAATSVYGDLRPTAYANPVYNNNFIIGGAGANQLLALFRGTLIMGASAGTLYINFAQGTAAAGTSATIKAGSTLQMRRIA
ncbi:hypothetical protein [Micromonospora sp. DT227]|uniref:hypothetical protein n=1 Tax=Micromonospora sp. DT227 TaxID=3393433 RepID=UPI003CF35D4A